MDAAFPHLEVLVSTVDPAVRDHAAPAPSQDLQGQETIKPLVSYLELYTVPFISGTHQLWA